MILQKHVLSFKCNDFLKMANFKAISSSARMYHGHETLNFDGQTVPCKAFVAFIMFPLSYGHMLIVTIDIYHHPSFNLFYFYFHFSNSY